MRTDPIILDIYKAAKEDYDVIEVNFSSGHIRYRDSDYEYVVKSRQDAVRPCVTAKFRSLKEEFCLYDTIHGHSPQDVTRKIFRFFDIWTGSHIEYMDNEEYRYGR